MKTYTTRNEAIQDIIVNSINAGEANATEYDIDAIAEQVIDSDVIDGEYVFFQKVDEDTFWTIVENNIR